MKLMQYYKSTILQLKKWMFWRDKILNICLWDGISFIFKKIMESSFALLHDFASLSFSASKGHTLFSWPVSYTLWVLILCSPERISIYLPELLGKSEKGKRRRSQFFLTNCFCVASWTHRKEVKPGCAWASSDSWTGLLQPVEQSLLSLHGLARSQRRCPFTTVVIS